MRQETSEKGVRGRGFGAIAIAAFAAATVLIAAGPASARNDFQNGFEDQLGRIAAHGAVGVGLRVLHGGYYPVAPVAYTSYYQSYDRHHYHPPRKVVVRYPKVHRHDRYCRTRHYVAPRHAYHGKHGKHGRKSYDYDDDDGDRRHGPRGRGW